jgi:hypothetical protein
MVRGVVGLVRAGRDAAPGNLALGRQQVLGRASLGGAIVMRDLGCHRQAITVFHQRMPHVAELRFASLGLSKQPRIGIGCACMGIVTGLLAIKSLAVSTGCAVIGSVLRTEAQLMTRPSRKRGHFDLISIWFANRQLSRRRSRW